ncbi:MAG TPA: hypothetical protein CFH84_09595 [Sulfurimonas sp. UBA12504]|nr:MAG: hypothetical protein A2019_01680 [Sulfurimonas sp. GWF2_37_8]DAB29417.1 MAG TPA: hypothetical protein CFH84_09595 [Sulfurimonas sp. UBA12504]
MSVGFTKLKELGAQKISEETHISKQHVQALIDENFKLVQKVQFLGFISIIERDYQIDLSELKTKALAYYAQNVVIKTPVSVFIEKKSHKSSKGIYIFIALIIFLAVAYYSLDSKSPTIDMNATQVESITQEIEALVESNMTDENITDNNLSALETNSSDLPEEEMEGNATLQTDEVPPVIPMQESGIAMDSLKIITTKKLWFGYIELDTEDKKQIVFSDSFELDPKKNWLLRLGHNDVEIELNGEKTSFEKSKNLQFLYKDGVLQQLSLSEFKKLNKDREW